MRLGALRVALRARGLLKEGAIIFITSTKFGPSFPGSSDGKASDYSAGDLGSIPGSERSPGEGNSNPLQYSCLQNPID